MCGIVGVFAPGQEAARLAFFSLFALQHRGQESAGICTADVENWLDRVRAILPRLEGAYCLVLLARDRVFVARDPSGIRPLALGRLEGGGWVAASETCALDTARATFIRELEPGELLEISA